jgi:hypothetical protein
VLPKAEVDFLRHKVQMWLILRHLHRVLLGTEPSAQSGVWQATGGESAEEASEGGGDATGCEGGGREGKGWSRTSLQVGQFVADFEATVDSVGMHRICSAYDPSVSSWLFRYLLVDEVSVLLVAPDARSQILTSVVYSHFDVVNVLGH